jgi:hypothetical protein
MHEIFCNNKLSYCKHNSPWTLFFMSYFAYSGGSFFRASNNLHSVLSTLTQWNTSGKDDAICITLKKPRLVYSKQTANSFCNKKQEHNSEFLGFHSGVAEVPVLLQCGTMSEDDLCPMFCDCIFVSSSRVEMYPDFETTKMSQVRYQSPSNVVPHPSKTTTSRT